VSVTSQLNVGGSFVFDAAVKVNVAWIDCPAFSKLDVQKDKETLRDVFQYSVKYASLLVIPVAALVMCLAEPAVSTLFGHTYASAPLFLALLALTYFLPAFGSLSAGNFLSSQGKTTLIMYLALLSAAIGIPLGYILIMQYGVLGLIITSLITGIINTAMPLYWVRKNYALTVNWSSSAKIMFSSSVTAILTYLVVLELGFSSLIRLVIGMVFFAVVFVAATLLTKTMTKPDIENLCSMAGGLRVVGKMFCRVLTIYDNLRKTLNL
jgi:O-antigen/teichoic acid export membrane protein